MEMMAAVVLLMIEIMTLVHMGITKKAYISLSVSRALSGGDADMMSPGDNG